MVTASTITLPAHWAPYLVNGDATGLTPAETLHIAAVLEAELPEGGSVVADVEDTERFTWSYRLYGGEASGGTVCDYTVLA